MKKLIKNEKKVEFLEYSVRRCKTTYHIMAEYITYKWKKLLFTVYYKKLLRMKTFLCEERNILLDRVITIRVGPLNVFIVYFSEIVCGIRK